MILFVFAESSTRTQLVPDATSEDVSHRIDDGLDYEPLRALSEIGALGCRYHLPCQLRIHSHTLLESMRNEKRNSNRRVCSFSHYVMPAMTIGQRFTSKKIFGHSNYPSSQRLIILRRSLVIPRRSSITMPWILLCWLMLKRTDLSAFPEFFSSSRPADQGAYVARPHAEMQQSSHKSVEMPCGTAPHFMLLYRLSSHWLIGATWAVVRSRSGMMLAAHVCAQFA